jgi:hypothetical protein
MIPDFFLSPVTRLHEASDIWSAECRTTPMRSRRGYGEVLTSHESLCRMCVDGSRRLCRATCWGWLFLIFGVGGLLCREAGFSELLGSKCDLAIKVMKSAGKLRNISAVSLQGRTHVQQQLRSTCTLLHTLLYLLVRRQQSSKSHTGTSVLWAFIAARNDGLFRRLTICICQAPYSFARSTDHAPDALTRRVESASRRLLN